MLRERSLGVARELMTTSNPAEITAWIENWPYIREDTVALIDAYSEQCADGAPASFALLIEEIDRAMRLLEHRVRWLDEHLAREAE